MGHWTTAGRGSSPAAVAFVIRIAALRTVTFELGSDTLDAVHTPASGPPMPIESKTLFHPAALRAGMTGFTPPPAAASARPKLIEWANMLGSGAAEKKKETELLPGFISDVFEAACGYTAQPRTPVVRPAEQ